MERNAIRIALVVEHNVFAEALRSSLDAQPQLRVVYVATQSGFDLEDLVGSRPEVCILDADLRDGTAFYFGGGVRQEVVHSKLLFLGDNPSETALEEAFRLNPEAYLLKSEPTLALVECVKQIADGRVRFSQPIAHRIRFDESLQRFVLRDVNRLGLLIRKQLEVLRYLANGDSVKLIAGKLHVSPKTIENHKYRIMHKIDIHDRVLLAHFAIREGLIQLRSQSDLSRPAFEPLSFGA